jgi:hypothetical protein
MAKATEGVDVGDTASVKKRKSKAELEQQRLDEDLLTALSTYQGRSLLWSQLEQAGIYHTTFNVDHGIMSFNEGMRQIGLRLLARIDGVDPNAYAKMRREAFRREEDK